MCVVLSKTVSSPIHPNTPRPPIQLLDYWDGTSTAPSPASASAATTAASPPASALPRQPLPRLEAALQRLFHQEAPGALLPAATYLLLSLALASPQARKPLFPDALGTDIKFTDLELSQRGGGAGAFGGDAGRAPLTPMFSILRTSTATQGGSLSQSQYFLGSQGGEVSQVRAGFIRATQQGGGGAGGGGGFVWTQTQGAGGYGGGGGMMMGGAAGGGGARAIDWVGSSVGASQAGVRSGSSLAVNLRTGPAAASDAARLMPPPPARKRPAAAAAATADGGDDEGEEDEGRRGAGGRPLVLYRRYRQGELPDIQIPLADLVRPLQALALRDAALARQLFALLFAPLFARAGPGARRRVLEGVRAAVAGALGETELVAGLHAVYRAAMELGGTGEETGEEGREGQEGGELLSPRLAAESGLKSLNYHSAVLLLEESLLRKQGLGVVGGSGGAAAGGGQQWRRSGGGGGRGGRGRAALVPADARPK